MKLSYFKKKIFSKIASPTTCCIDEREKSERERAAISYFLSFISLMFL